MSEKTTPAKSLKLVILQSILRLEMRRKSGIARNPKDLKARAYIAKLYQKMPQRENTISVSMGPYSLKIYAK